MIASFKRFFDSRPSSIESAKNDRQPCYAPESWTFSGWLKFSSAPDSAGIPIDPHRLDESDRDNVAGFFEIDGFVAAIHESASPFAGCRMHILFMPELPPPNLRAEFVETREGGLMVRHNARNYFRQLHIHPRSRQGLTRDEIEKIESEERALPFLLNGSLKAGSRIKLSGIVNWIEFHDKANARDWTFYGWDRRISCPCISIYEWQHLPPLQRNESALEGTAGTARLAQPIPIAGAS